MKNNHAIAPIIGVIIIASAIGASAGSYVIYENNKSYEIEPNTVFVHKDYGNGLDNSKETTSQPVVTEYEITTNTAISNILSYIGSDTTIDVDSYRGCIDKLNVNVYCVNGKTMDSIIDDYKTKINEDGYTIEIEQDRDNSGWSGKLIFARGSLHGRLIVVASGSVIEKIFGCDVLLITSSAFLTDYYSCQHLIEGQSEEPNNCCGES